MLVFVEFPNGPATPQLTALRGHIYITSHSAYAETETKLLDAKIDGLLPPNFQIFKSWFDYVHV